MDLANNLPEKPSTPPGDKYKAVWVSHSSISNFLKCPRLYYLHDVYKDPRTGNKMSITNPAMALGLAVHEVLETLADFPSEERFSIPLTKKFDVIWQKYGGELGGFRDSTQESEYKERGARMLGRLDAEPGILLNKTIKIPTDLLPNYWISEEDNIILCGKVDWIEYLPETDSVHIVDFKTGKNVEEDSSLQLPIYYLLAKNTQKREVVKASYWYLDNETGMVEKPLPDEKESKEAVMSVATRIKLARAINRMVCETNGCKHCTPYERILKGEGKKVGVSTTRQDVYII